MSFSGMYSVNFSFTYAAISFLSSHSLSFLFVVIVNILGPSSLSSESEEDKEEVVDDDDDDVRRLFLCFFFEICFPDLFLFFLGELLLLPSSHFTGSLSCLLYTSPSPRDLSTSRMPSSA